MQRILGIITMLAWALWLGGLVALLMFVVQIFHVGRDLLLRAGPVLFGTFAMYQIVVGLIACIAAVSVTVMARRRALAVLCLFLLAALGAAIIVAGWTDTMLDIIAAGESSQPPFVALHVKTNIGYTFIAACLVIFGIGWIFTLTRATTLRKGEETAAARAFPGEAAGQSGVA